MKNNKKRIRFIVIIAVILIMLLGIIFGFKLRIKDGGLYIGNSVLKPYAYTIYKDHVVLEKYHGHEEEVVIPSEIFGKPVKEIGYSCFEVSEELKKVILNENVIKIGNDAFVGCDNLIEITQGENIKAIGDSAFSSCDELKEVELGNQVEEIQDGAFARCKKIKKMYPQEALVSIGEFAFIDSGLEEFVFNRDVEIGARAFAGTCWIQNQPEEFVIYGDGNLIGYNGVDKKVVIPEGVKILNGGCFKGTTAEEIYVPETVTEMRQFIFSNCPNNIKVYIPASVTQVGDAEGEYSINNNDASITIITTKDSAAHRHAKEQDIPYELVEEW